MPSVSARPAVPPLEGHIAFNAQHSPMGAFMSFTCGHFGTPGGIGVEIGQPAGQNLFIGIKEGDRCSNAPLRCLPFFRNASSGGGAADFLVEQAGPAEQSGTGNVVATEADRIRRHYGWASDGWATDNLRFMIYTPFGSLPDPDGADPRALGDALAPAVVAELEVDNRTGAGTRTAVFGVQFDQPGVRLISVGTGAQSRPRHGFSLHDRIGFAAESDVPADAPAEQQLFPFQRWNVADAVRDPAPVHALGKSAGFALEVPPGEIRRVRLAFGCFLAGIVTTGLEGRYLYTRLFSSLADVLGDVLSDGRFEQRVQKSAELDAELLCSGLSPEQQFLIAHATRSYYGSTQLLDIGGEPCWIVNEGEYCMMNTLDLAVDQVFWELDRNPWVVRNLLDQFTRRYFFTDQVKVYLNGAALSDSSADPDRDPSRPPPPADAHQLNRAFKLAAGGVSFTHDMGAHNNFSPAATSSYELAELTGCFSHMTQEQLCNWVLSAGCYVARTCNRDWAVRNRHVLGACLESLHARRDEPGGPMTRDSARCGRGSEITTYDSLDESLGQARSNVYVAVKRWASYAALRMIDRITNLGGDLAAGAEEDLAYFPKRLAAEADERGILPAVLEPENPGHASRILAACEALVYPWYWSIYEAGSAEDIPGHSALVGILKRHTRALLTDPYRRNLFDDGGIRLSSTSNNSWMSKIALFQVVARQVFHLDKDPVIDRLLIEADTAHVEWQTVGSAYWACSDQIVNGVARASRYYPRIVTTALWLREQGQPKAAEALDDGHLVAL